MPAKPTTIADYLAALPEDRRQVIEAIRKVINANIDKAFEEGMQYGMPSWYLPHSRYPAGYHCDPSEPLPFASVGSQKHHIGIYLFCIYGDGDQAQQFRDEWVATGKKLDMGKACIRVKKLDDVALDVLGRVLERVTAAKFVAVYEAARDKAGTGRKPARKAAVKKAAVTNAAVKKQVTAKKKVAGKKVTKKATARKRAVSRG